MKETQSAIFMYSLKNLNSLFTVKSMKLRTRFFFFTFWLKDKMSLKAFYNIFKSFELYTFPSQEFHTLHDVPTEICSNLKNEA